MPLTREQIAQRVARELRDGYYVNLGIGIPTLVSNYVPKGIEVVLQSENGDLANWLVPGKMVKGMGGGMDLVAGARRTVVMMDHATKEGKPKILKQCTLPITGRRVVSAICTDRAWIDVTPDGLVLRELAPGETFESVQKLTEPRLKLAPDVRPMQL